MRSRRARVVLAGMMANAVAAESAIGSQGVLSDGSGDCATVSGLDLPYDEKKRSCASAAARSEAIVRGSPRA